MSVKKDFLAVEKEQESWLGEFLNSPNAKQLSDFQKENIEKMLLFLIKVAKINEVYPNTWTGETVVDLVVNHICQTLPEEPAFFDAYPGTMALFFDFLAEKDYMPNGKEIGQSLLAAKATIFQTEENKDKLEKVFSILQEGIDAGIDFTNPVEGKKYLQAKAKETEVLNRYFEKKDAGVPISEIMEQMTKEEQDILAKDAFKDISSDFNLKEAERGLAILKAELAKGKSIEEASKSVPEALIPAVLNLLRPSVMGNSESPTLSLPAKQRYKSKRKKVGRNAPCPCGSGKKYKQCCIRRL